MRRGRLKLGDTGETALHRLETLEALALGIQGKLALWRGWPTGTRRFSPVWTSGRWSAARGSSTSG